MDTERASAIIGEHLANLRGRKSRRELSEMTGVPEITIRRIEQGKRPAQTPTLLVLVRALGSTGKDFMDAVEAELDKIGNT